MIAIGVIFFVISLCVNKNRENGKYKAAILYGGIAAYLYFILVITILGRPSMGVMQAHLVPLWTWHHVIFGGGRWYYLKENLLNVLMFMPIGFLAGAIWRIKAWCGFLYGLGLSLVIELIQLLSCKGEFEWDDMLYNAVGFLLGLIIINIIKKTLSIRHVEARDEFSSRLC